VVQIAVEKANAPLRPAQIPVQSSGFGQQRP
jgi:hypothetical protein